MKHTAMALKFRGMTNSNDKTFVMYIDGAEVKYRIIGQVLGTDDWIVKSLVHTGTGPWKVEKMPGDDILALIKTYEAHLERANGGLCRKRLPIRPRQISFPVCVGHS